MLKTRSLARQCWATCVANLATMSAGCVLGWTSPTLTTLKLPGAFMNSTSEQSSWIVSLALLGGAIGAFPAGFLADQIGRKYTMLLLAIPLILMGWILIIAAQNIAMIYLGRFICGLGMGAAWVLTPMYIGEIAQDNIRGGLGSTCFFFLSAGYLYEYAIGPYVSYICLGVISLIVPIVFAMMFVYMPESPYYFLMKGKKGEASLSLQWLRNSTEVDVENELMIMQDFVDDSLKNSRSCVDIFTTPGTVRALLLTCGLVTFQVLSGIDAVLFYSTNIFQSAGGSLSGTMSTIVIGAVTMIFALVAPLLVDQTGRKPMLYVSSLGMAASEFMLGIYFYYKDVKGMDLSIVSWLPLVSMVIYTAILSVGYGPLPWTIMLEIFPTNNKGLAIAFTSSFCWFLDFLTTKFLQNIVDSLGIHGAFWLYGSFCISSNIFVFFLLPETKCKSFQEIQNILNKTYYS